MEQKVTNSLQVNIPTGSFVDEGDGVVSFPQGLTITDDSVQRNGTRYDINSLDTSQYGNQLTGDHEDKLSSLIGEVQGVTKLNGKVIVNKIRYAIKENPYARLAYDLLIGGFSKNFSTETIGPRPDDEGFFRNAELVGLSQVVTQNNYNARINAVVHNSLEQSKQDGLDVAGIEEKFLNELSVKEETKMEDEKQKVEATEEQTAVAEAPKEAETKTEEVETTENNAEAKTEVKKAENGTWIETTTTSTTREYVESEEEKEERKAREAKWDAQEERRLKAEETPDVAVVVVESENETSEKTENKTEETETTENEVADTTEEVVEEKETNKKEEKMDEDKKTVETQVNGVTAEQVAEIVANALKPFAEQVTSLEEKAENAFNASAKEPEFKKDENAVEEEKAENKYAEMDFDERYNLHINAAWDAVKIGNVEAQQTLRELNAYNLAQLKEQGIAKNAIGLEELGNFVIAPEMYTEIQGHRNDYTAILSATEWKETLSLQFAWLKRVGDIDMRNVALQDTDEAPNGALKPISEYSAVPQTSNLEELAAVTVVATSATRFAAVDLLSDAAAGYRNDYDRKRAQLVIAKLEEAVDETGYSVAYNPANDVDALKAWLTAVTEISDTTLNGTLIFNARTFAELKSRAVGAGVQGPLSEILTTGDMPTVWGYRFIVVPNDLMPSLGGNESISHEVEGESKVISHAVFFADLTTFTGRTSGGLQYDVSNSAPYEVGGVVRSAYQRNQLVLRGSFFRGGAVKDVEVVAGIRQGSGPNVS